MDYKEKQGGAHQHQSMFHYQYIVKITLIKRAVSEQTFQVGMIVLLASIEKMPKFSDRVTGDKMPIVA